MSCIDDLGRDLDRTSSLPELQEVVGRYQPSAFDARLQKTRLRAVLQGCAKKVPAASEVIEEFLWKAAGTSAPEIDALSAAFQRDIAAIVPAEEDPDPDAQDSETPEEPPQNLPTIEPAEEQTWLTAIRASPNDATPRRIFVDRLLNYCDPRARMTQHVPGTELFLKLWTEVPEAYARQTEYLTRMRREHPNLHIPDPPPFDRVLNTFSPEQWEALEHLYEPRMILIPPLDFSTCEQLLNEHPHTSGQYPTIVDGLYRTHEHPASQHWQVFFIEGGETTDEPAPYARDLSLEERIQNEERIRPAIVQGIHRYHYAWLMLDSLERTDDPRAQIDADTWTILNADNVWVAGDRSLVPGAGRVIFICDGAERRLDDARLRRAVGGDVV